MDIENISSNSGSMNAAAATPSKKHGQNQQYPLRSPLRMVDTNIPMLKDRQQQQQQPASAKKHLQLHQVPTPVLHDEPCQRCSEMETIVEGLQKKNKELGNAVINGEQEILAWEEEYKKLEESTLILRESYEIKSIKVKELNSQNEEIRQNLASCLCQNEELKRTLADEREIIESMKAKARAQTEEHKGNFARISSLMQANQALLDENKQLMLERNKMKHADGSSSTRTAIKSDSCCQTEEEKDSNEEPVSIGLKHSKGSGVDAEIQTTLQLMDAPLLVPSSSSSSSSSSSIEGLKPQELVARNESLSISNDLLREEATALHRELERLGAEMKKLNDLDRSRQAETRQWKTSADNNAQALLQSRESVMRLEDEIAQMCDKMNQDTDRYENLQDELNLAIAEVSRATGRAEQAESALQSKGAIIAKLESDLRLMYKKHKKDMEDMEAKFKSEAYREKYTASIEKLTRLQRYVDSCIGFVAECTEVESLQQLVSAEQETTVMLLVQGFKTLQSSLAEYKENETVMKQKAQRAQAEIATLVHEGNANKQQIVQLRAEIEATTEDYSACKEALIDMKQELDWTRGELRSTKEFQEALGELVLKMVHSLNSTAANAQRSFESLSSEILSVGNLECTWPTLRTDLPELEVDVAIDDENGDEGMGVLARLQGAMVLLKETVLVGIAFAKTAAARENIRLMVSGLGDAAFEACEEKRAAQQTQSSHLAAVGLTARLEATRKRETTLEQQVQELKGVLEHKEEEIESLTNQLIEANYKYSEIAGFLEQENEVREDVTTQLEKDALDLREELQRVSTGFTTLKENVEQVQKSIWIAVEHAKTCYNSSANGDEDISNSTGAEQCSNELDKVGFEVIAALSTMSEKLVEAEQKIKEKQDEVESIQKQMNEVQVVSDELNLTVNAMRKKIIQAERERSNLVTNASNAEAEIQKLNEQITELLSGMESLKVQHEEKLTATETASTEVIQDLEEKLSQSITRYESIKQHCDTLMTKLTETEQERDAAIPFGDHCATLQADNEQLLSDLSKLQESYNKLQKDYQMTKHSSETNSRSNEHKMKVLKMNLMRAEEDVQGLTALLAHCRAVLLHIQDDPDSESITTLLEKLTGLPSSLSPVASRGTPKRTPTKFRHSRQSPA